MYLLDLNSLSNGGGKSVYGDRLDAYSFVSTTCEIWFNEFVEMVDSAIEKKEYLPIYRIADGEMRLLFGLKINKKAKFIRSVLRYVKYEILKWSWETSWGERYSVRDIDDLRILLKKYVKEISDNGILAIYWNENGLNAFTEYNKSMISLFSSFAVTLTQKNYVPFHFSPALLALKAKKILSNRHVLIVSGMDDDEYNLLKRRLGTINVKSVQRYKCSSSSALLDDYKNIITDNLPDIVLVAAGIGSAKVLVDLSYFKCPIIDIGSYIHVLSTSKNEAHAGFFIS